MGSIPLSLMVFVCVLGGAVCGMLFRDVLPEDHLSHDSRDAVKLGMGLVATMSALVLGLLVSSAKSSYDTQSSEVTDMSAKVILLDRVLAHYGPETKESRDLLRVAVVDNLNRIWPEEAGQVSKVGPPSISKEALLDNVESLSPKDEEQHSLQSLAITMAFNLAQTRWLMYEQATGSISKPMLVVLVFWLTALFMSFGLAAPRNATVVVALFISALSVSGAIFLILEMYSPFSGLIHISSAPLRFALAQLGQ